MTQATPPNGSDRSQKPRTPCRSRSCSARASNHIRGHDDLDDTIARLQAYEDAGADVLLAPGVRDPADIRRICDAVTRPLNVLAVAEMSLDAIADAGAQRVSVG